MKRVTGIGGVFFKAEDPEKLYGWYEKHLGLKREPHGQGVMLHWRDPENPEPTGGMTVWSLREDYDYGRFGWATDPEGNRFALWQPPTAADKT